MEEGRGCMGSMSHPGGNLSQPPPFIPSTPSIHPIKTPLFLSTHYLIYLSNYLSPYTHSIYLFICLSICVLKWYAAALAEIGGGVMENLPPKTMDLSPLHPALICPHRTETHRSCRCSSVSQMPSLSVSSAAQPHSQRFC